MDNVYGLALLYYLQLCLNLAHLTNDRLKQNVCFVCLFYYFLSFSIFLFFPPMSPRVGVFRSWRFLTPPLQNYCHLFNDFLLFTLLFSF